MLDNASHPWQIGTSERRRRTSILKNLGHEYVCMKYLQNWAIFWNNLENTSQMYFFADVLHSGIAWQTNHSSHVTLLDWLSIALLALVYRKLQAVMSIKWLSVAYPNFMEILKMWKNFYWSLLRPLPPQMFFSNDATCHHLNQLLAGQYCQWL